MLGGIIYSSIPAIGKQLARITDRSAFVGGPRFIDPGYNHPGDAKAAEAILKECAFAALLPQSR